jgi:hypothetical protein
MEERKELSVKSMEFCQGTISRMARNSFNLKAWFLVAFSALFTFFAKSVSGETDYQASLMDLIWLLPMFMFPILDAYYLKQERMFRDVYNDFVNSINGDKDVRRPFDLKPTAEQRTRFTLLNVIFSVSVGWLYFPLLAAFQGLIIFHSTECSFLWMSIFPLGLIVMSLTFKKKTPHQQT